MACVIVSILRRTSDESSMRHDATPSQSPGSQQDADHLAPALRGHSRSEGCGNRWGVPALPCSDTWTRTAKAEWTGCGIRASQRPSASWPLSVTSSGGVVSRSTWSDCRGVRPNREADWHPSGSHPGTQIPQGPGIEVAAHPRRSPCRPKKLGRARSRPGRVSRHEAETETGRRSSRSGSRVLRGRRSLRVRHVSLLPVVVHSNLRAGGIRASTVQRPGGMERRDAGTDRCDQHDGRQH